MANKINNFYKIPFSEKKDFCGRVDKINLLKTTLEEHRLQCIIGMGGVGKSHLAAKYVYLNKNNYHVIFWINGIDKSSIIKAYCELAEQLGLCQENVDIEIMLKNLSNWFMENDEWLIVFDNVHDFQLISEVMPNQYKGHIIITSLNPNCNNMVNEPIFLSILSKDDSKELISNTLKDARIEDIHLLSKKLGALPIAIEHAITYITNNAISIEYYLELYEKHRLELLHRKVNIQKREESIFTTWSISIEKIQSVNKNAIVIAKILSFFDSNNIPRDIIKIINYKDIFNLDIDDLELVEIVGMLREYSLINATPYYLSMHCIIQEFIRKYINEEQNNDLLEKLSSSINDFLTSNIIVANDFKTYSETLNHSKKILQYLNQYEIYNFDRVDLLGKISVYLRKIGQIDEALDLCLQASKIQQNIKEYKHISPPSIYNLLAGLYSEKLDFKSAQEYYKQSLDIITNNGDLYDDLNEIVTQNNIAFTYMKLSKFGEAKVLLESCLSEVNKKSNLDKQVIMVKISILSNLSLVLNEFEELDDALKLSKKACELSEKTHGENSILYAREQNNYANLILLRGNIDGAKKRYDKSILIYIDCLGENNRELPNAYNNIARCLMKMRDYSKALKYVEQALEINKKFYEFDNYTFASIYETLGSIYLEKEEYSKALINLERSNEIIKKHIDSDVKLIALYRIIGKCKIKMDSRQNGKNELDKSIIISEKLFGKHSNLYFNINYNVAVDLIEMNEFVISIEYLKNCLRLLKNNSEVDENKKYNVWLYVGGAYCHMEKYEKSVRAYNKCLKIALRTSNVDSIAGTYSNLASVYSYIDNIEKAIAYLRKAKSMEINNCLKKEVENSIKENVELITSLNYEDFLVQS
ncbi:tetratricopeptide repeat protein [Clostridium estertheticum]|uniref:tetratricopeptide repeat protein n=1 Tax=Clostridium estertheticum TaxID=238834 RepID=UPI001CF4C201|nr:tetratricopeptide repeat protein [Clostridium estertheticum]MCB2358672.1 tetratricopeptide repeat protein [Clostridium estertheticum]